MEEAGAAAGPLVMAFTVDAQRRMMFVRIIRVPDPDAPSRPLPEVASREEARARDALYFDGLIEAFTLHGDLVASTRFDDVRDMPWPIGGGAPGNLWYRIADDLTESIEVLRPELREKVR